MKYFVIIGMLSLVSHRKVNFILSFWCSHFIPSPLLVCPFVYANQLLPPPPWTALSASGTMKPSKRFSNIYESSILWNGSDLSAGECHFHIVRKLPLWIFLGRSSCTRSSRRRPIVWLCTPPAISSWWAFQTNSGSWMFLWMTSAHSRNFLCGAAERFVLYSIMFCQSMFIDYLLFVLSL